MSGLAALIRRPYLAHCQACVRSWPSATPEGARLLADDHQARTRHPAIVVLDDAPAGAR